ncbi:MAG: hypothetical protein JWM71_539 [Solirubrobacteraceae bacterium]|nr:hypothetical protein [Solirubrobacteraceae bacterium]
MRSWLGPLTAVAVLVPVAGAAADTMFLYSPGQLPAGPPPLGVSLARLQSTTEIRVPGLVDARQLVDVGLSPDGVPVSVTATVRLVLHGLGDYSFVVPAPATSVVRGPGSDSQPGLRDVGIVWQGFSAGRRVLSAIARLRPAPASAGLPLAVRVDRGPGSAVVRLTDLARRHLSVSTGSVPRSQLLTALEQLQRSLLGSTFGGAPLYATGRSGKPASIVVAAPLHITGTITGSRSRRAVDIVLGHGHPLDRAWTVPGAGTPDVRLRVELLAPRTILPTLGEVARARQPLPLLQAALGALATTTLYRRYLGSPDPSAKTDTAYVYRSTNRLPSLTGSAATTAGSAVLAILLVVVLVAAALSALAALWARS